MSAYNSNVRSDRIGVGILHHESNKASEKQNPDDVHEVPVEADDLDGV